MSLPFWSSEKAAATLDRVLPASQDALGPGAQVVAVLAVRDDTRKIRKRTLELDVLRLRAAERELERSPIEQVTPVGESLATFLDAEELVQEQLGATDLAPNAQHQAGPWMEPGFIEAGIAFIAGPDPYHPGEIFEWVSHKARIRERRSPG